MGTESGSKAWRESMKNTAGEEGSDEARPWHRAPHRCCCTGTVSRPSEVLFEYVMR